MDLEQPGPDHVRVLAVLDNTKRKWLVDAAKAAWQGRPCKIDKNEARLPPGFVPDEDFCPIPLGPTHPSEFTFDNQQAFDPAVLDPANSKFFVIRGFLEVGPRAVPKHLDGLDLYSDPRTYGTLTCGTDRAVGSVDDVRNKLDVGRLAANGLDGQGVAVAIVDSGIFLQHLTRINLLTGNPERTRPLPRYPLVSAPQFDGPNSWQPLRVATPPGGHRLGHGTMCAYDVLAVAPKATLLDYPILIARPPGDHTVTGTVSAALEAYWRLLLIWINNILGGGPPNYKALVVNNSWGIFHPSLEDFPPGHPGRFIDNPNHVFHILVWILARLGVDIVFSAGNGGMPCPVPPFLHLTTGSIRGASAYPEVLTVAGCDVNDDRVGYSSQGPSIAMFPVPPAQKPDLTAYTHFLGSQVMGERAPDAGTSAACPIAAGCVAALRTNLPPAGTSPAALFSELRNTARQVGAAGWNQDYGYGIINPVAAGRNLGLIP